MTAIVLFGKGEVVTLPGGSVMVKIDVDTVISGPAANAISNEAASKPKMSRAAKRRRTSKAGKGSAKKKKELIDGMENVSLDAEPAGKKH